MVGNESIESTTRAKPAFNSCIHTKMLGHNYAYQAVYPKAVSTSCGLRDYFRIPMWVGTSVPLLNGANWTEFDDAQRRAWWSMQPRFESEIQFLNFIYEMKDFKTIAKHLLKFEVSKIGSKMVGLRNQLRRMSREYERGTGSAKTLADITKTAAEARLVYSFAILPLISDITAILKTLALTVQEAQNRFSQAGSSGNSLSHYTESYPHYQTGAYGTADNNRFMWFGTSSDSVFTATLQYNYRYKMRQGWDLFKRGWGLEVNAEVLWNAIPFSFLVDYFYKVGQAIHTMSVDPNVYLKLHQYCESILVTASSGVMIDPTRLAYFYAPSATKRTNGLVPMVGITGTRYTRRVTSPNKGMATPILKTPKGGQLWNMAALARCFFS